MKPVAPPPPSSPRSPSGAGAASIPGTAATPSAARHIAMGFVVTLAMITYSDRVIISQAAPEIRRALTLDEKQMGWVFFAFTATYALCEIPAGRLGDRYGPRSVLMKVVLMWSLFTAATGAVWNYVSLLVCRMFFGAGEAGCFPNATKIFTIWLPSRERERAQGILWLSARWGGAFTPAIVAWVMTGIGWRYTFAVFGLVGVVWAVAFYRWFRDRPREHPAVNAAELALLDGAEKNAPAHVAVPWRRLLASRTVWMLWLQYFCISYGWYFYITWLPTYLREARHLDLGKSALLGGLPLFVGGFGCIAGGWLARHYAEKWHDVRRARRVVAGAGIALAGVMLIAATQIDQVVLGIVALSLASFGNDLSLAPSWSACMDVGGRHTGSLSGSMNMVGNFGGALGPLVVGYILDAGKATAKSPPLPESWTHAFLLGAVVYFIGAISWWLIDPVTPLEAE